MCSLRSQSKNTSRETFPVTRCVALTQRTTLKPNLKTISRCGFGIHLEHCPTGKNSPKSLRNYLFSVLTDILPKQETFPETDAKNCTKATSITGLSVTARGNVWGFKVSPALVSASGTITCRDTQDNISVCVKAAAPCTYSAPERSPRPKAKYLEDRQRFTSTPSLIITTNPETGHGKETCFYSDTKELAFSPATKGMKVYLA